MLKTKSRPVYGFKAVDGTPGRYEAYYAVFGNVDLVNDRIVEGAFEKTLAEWKESGDPIPVIFSHQWDSLEAHVGEVLEAEERKAGDDRLPPELADFGGLYTKFQLDMEDAGGKKMDRLLSKRRIREGSFAYDIPEGGQRKAQDGANELVELVLIEVGPTLKGANPMTRLASAEAHGTKAFVAVQGSFEDLQRTLRKALSEDPPEVPGDVMHVGLEATFAEKLIAFAWFWDGPDKYFEITYTMSGNTPEFGEMTEVAIQGVVTPVATKASKQAPSKAKVEEPETAKTEEPRGTVTKALLELAELEAS